MKFKRKIPISSKEYYNYKKAFEEGTPVIYQGVERWVVDITRTADNTTATGYAYCTLEPYMNGKEYKGIHDEHAKTWEFNSICSLDIDFGELMREVTRQNPLLLVDGGVEKYVVVHETLMIKATRGHNIPGPEMPVWGENLPWHGRVYRTEKPFSEWVAWAKKVKAEPWPKIMRRKVKFTVSVPKV